MYINTKFIKKVLHSQFELLAFAVKSELIRIASIDPALFTNIHAESGCPMPEGNFAVEETRSLVKMIRLKQLLSSGGVGKKIIFL